MSVDWRTWLYQRAITVFDAADVHAAGSLEGAPSNKHFLVIRLDDDLPGPIPNIRTQDCVLNVHDEPGSYKRIGTKIGLLEEAISNGPAIDHHVGVVFQGVSGDLADDTYKTIFRSLSFRLHGRKN